MRSELDKCKLHITSRHACTTSSSPPSDTNLTDTNVREGLYRSGDRVVGAAEADLLVEAGAQLRVAHVEQADEPAQLLHDLAYFGGGHDPPR